MTEDRPPRAPRLVLLTAVLLAACSAPSASPSSSTTEAPPTSAAAPSVTVDPSSPPAVEPATPEPPIPEPPAAAIVVEGGDPVIGELGSFAWIDAGSTAPWLDGSPIHVGTGERLIVTLAEPVGLSNWMVTRQPPGARDGLGAIGLAEGSGEPLTFAAPPAGSWSVSVDVWFADNLGSASYFWLVEVD